jgi:octaprenyl-diphosphate synthase
MPMTKPSIDLPHTLPLYSSLVTADMLAVDAVISRRLASSVPLVSQVSRYIIAAGGKRLRPVLLLLVCGALGYRGTDQLAMAAVVEFIHTATLLHDDVVDESTLRRGRPTANESFGNPASVLVGDFLYSRAFQMMVETNNMRVLATLAEATNVIAEGEVMQLMNMHDASLTPEAYLHVIESKTAKLFEASSRLGAILAGATPAIEQACAAYGAALGTAFQLIDDVLDYAGDAVQMGKNLGDDLREGKATLPLIFAMKMASVDEGALIKKAIEAGDLGQLEAISRIVHSSGALDASMAFAKEQAKRAAIAVQPLPEGVFKDALLELPMLSLARTH